MSYYQKFRPQNLEQLLGQDVVKQTILDAFKSGRLSHAYIFVGPRGTGKTSMARILAKMVNCEGKGETGKGEVPCNKCSTCISITDGSNLDLIEIDAASNRGIEDIRSLREKIKLSPTLAKKKVYIIDEVHMLTNEAFNGLLKTLEEPPNHVIFILATTEASKVPETIISRCIRLDFSLASTQDLRLALEKIIKSEKIEIEEDAVDLLISKADGSFRDGVKMLDQVASKKGKINASDVLNNFRSSDFANLEKLLLCFSEKKTKDGLVEIKKLVDGGADMKDTIGALMDLFRNLMLILNGVGEILVKPNKTAEKYEKLTALSEKFENKDIVKNLEILQKALEQLKFATIASLPLELAVLEICEEEQKEKLDVRSEKMDKEVRDLKLENQTSNIQPQDPVSNFQHPPSNSDSPDIIKLKEKWTFVLETIRPYNFSLEALLRSVRISNINEVNVIMEVPYSFHQRILEAPKNRDLLEGVLSEILGRTIRVSCVLGTRPVRAEDVANIEVAQDDEIVRIASEIFNSDSVN